MSLQKMLESHGFRRHHEGRSGQIEDAASKKRLLKIIYQRKDGVHKKYQIEPYSYRDKKGERYLFGHDIKDGTIKMFLLKNLLDADSLEETSFDPRFPVEIGK